MRPHDEDCFLVDILPKYSTIKTVIIGSNFNDEMSSFKGKRVDYKTIFCLNCPHLCHFWPPKQFLAILTPYNNEILKQVTARHV